MTLANIGRYRQTFMWIVAIFDGAEPEAVWEIRAASLEPFFALWESRLRELDPTNGQRCRTILAIALHTPRRHDAAEPLHGRERAWPSRWWCPPTTPADLAYPPLVRAHVTKSGLRSELDPRTLHAAILAQPTSALATAS